MACLLYVAYLGYSLSLGSDADGAGNALQAWDMLQGNLLLHSWWLSDVSFYTTELPEYMLVELVRGLHATDMSVAGAATYTVVVLLAALVAKGGATGREGLVRALIAAGIMLSPGPGLGAGILLGSPDHVGTQIPLLLTWLAIDRLADRWYLPWLVGAILTWVEIADQMAIYVGALPVIAVSALRLYQRRPSWRIDAGLLVAAAASVGVAVAALPVIHRAGGFHVAPAGTLFTTTAEMPHNVWLTFEAVLALFGADFFGLRFGLTAAVALLHLVGVILAAWACCIAARRLFPAGDRLVPILVTGIAVDLAAFTFSTQAVDLGSARDLAPVLVFGAVLAGAHPVQAGDQSASSRPARRPGRLYRCARIPRDQARQATADAGGRVVADGEPSDRRDRRLLGGEHHHGRDQWPGPGAGGRYLLRPLRRGCLGGQEVVVRTAEHRAVPRARTDQLRRGQRHRGRRHRPVRGAATDRPDRRLRGHGLES